MTNPDMPTMPPRPAWYDQAACRGMGAALFHPPPLKGRPANNNLDAAKAIAVCDRCPVRAECLDEAMSFGWYLDYASGAIRGGLTSHERRKPHHTARKQASGASKRRRRAGGAAA